MRTRHEQVERQRDHRCHAGQRAGPRAAREPSGIYDLAYHFEVCLGRVSMLPTLVAIPESRDVRSHGKPIVGRHPIGKQKISFVNCSLSELLGERAVAGGCFGEDQQPRGFLVEPMDDRKRSPTRLAMP